MFTKRSTFYLQKMSFFKPIAPVHVPFILIRRPCTLIILPMCFSLTGVKRPASDDTMFIQNINDLKTDDELKRAHLKFMMQTEEKHEQHMKSLLQEMKQFNSTVLECMQTFTKVIEKLNSSDTKSAQSSSCCTRPVSSIHYHYPPSHCSASHQNFPQSSNQSDAHYRHSENDNHASAESSYQMPNSNPNTTGSDSLLDENSYVNHIDTQQSSLNPVVNLNLKNKRRKTSPTRWVGCSSNETY